MATSFIEAAHGELTCPICMELFVEPHIPKNMPACAHVVCEICLNKLSHGKKRSLKIKCPECRKSVKLPSSGVSALKTNLRLGNLAGLAIKQPKSDEAKNVVPTCSQHDGEKMHYYCVPCNTLACQACLMLNHQGTSHEVQGAKERYLEKKAQIVTITANMNAQIESWKIMVEQHTKLKDGISHNNEEAKINKCVESRIEEIRKQGQTLKDELKVVEEKSFAKIDAEINRFKSKINTAEKASHQMNEVLSNYSLIMWENVLGVNNGIKEDSTVPNHLCINAQFVEDTKPMGSIGRIVTQNRALELVQTFGDFKRAQSIACSQDGLLAVCDLDGQQVTVYHKRDGEYKMKLKLLLHILDSKEQWRVVNVHFTADGKILVARGKFIEVYSSTGMYQKTVPTVHKSETKVIVNSITVAGTGNIFAGDVHRSLITEHDPTGRVIRSIPTSIKPRYVACVQETQIAMSDCESGKISIVDKLSKKETFYKDLPEVNGICYDAKSDCILTVRNIRGDRPLRVKEGSGVIEQHCCKTGKLVSRMAEGLYHPTDLAFTSDRMLAVADHKYVKMFKVL